MDPYLPYVVRVAVWRPPAEYWRYYMLCYRRRVWPATLARRHEMTIRHSYLAFCGTAPLCQKILQCGELGM